MFYNRLVELSTYPEDRLVPSQRGPGARHLHCPDSSVVSSQKPPLLQFKHYFMFFWCWKNSVLLLYSVNGVLLYFHASGLPPTSYRWSTDFFVKQKSVIFVFFIVVNLIVSFFISFWRHLACFFFFFLLYIKVHGLVRFGSISNGAFTLYNHFSYHQQSWTKVWKPLKVFHYI